MGKWRRGISAILALMLGGSALVCSTALAKPAQTGVKKPGEAGYVSLHKYATPTDIEDVYKITLNIDPASVIVAAPHLPVYAAITIDPSTSMYNDDIWDSSGAYHDDGVPRWISRYAAIELAVEAFIHELVTSGNTEIYISLSGHTRASVVTPGVTGLVGFEKIFDASGALKPKFQRGNASWVMTNWGDNDTGTTVTGHTTAWGNSGDNDIGQALTRVFSDFRDSIVNGAIPGTSSRFILVMGDGADTSGNFSGTGVPLTSYNLNTQRIAMAVKAPLDANYAAGTGTAATQVAGLSTAVYGGIGAQIWGVTVGDDVNHNTAWQTEFFNTNYATLWDFAATNNTGKSPDLILGFSSNAIAPAEYWMIADTVDVPSYPTVDLGSTTNYLSHYHSLGSFTIDAATPKNSNVHYYHSMVTEAQPSAAALAANTRWKTGASYNTYGRGNWRPNTTPLLEVFQNFAEAASSGTAGGGTDITVTDVIGSQFGLYQYLGEPLFNLQTTDTSATFTQSVSNAGKTINWKMSELNPGESYNLTYYVKINANSADPGLWYPTNEYAYICYSDENGDPVLLYFPEPLVNVVGDISSQEPEVETDSGTIDTVDPSNVLHNIPMFVGTYGTPLQPYTPSVTPSPAVEVEEEFLADGTVEGYDGVVPWTGQRTYAVVVILMVCFAGGIVLLWRRRTLRR